MSARTVVQARLRKPAAHRLAGGGDKRQNDEPRRKAVTSLLGDVSGVVLRNAPRRYRTQYKSQVC